MMRKAFLFLFAIFCLINAISAFCHSSRIRKTPLHFHQTRNDLVSPTLTDHGYYFERAAGFYDAWNQKDIKKAIDFFSDNVFFVDGQYSKPFRGKKEVKNYLQECADSLPGWKFIIDDHAEDIKSRKVALKWHVEDSSKMPLPFPTNGLSFVVFDECGKIVECTDMIEATVKTGIFQLPLLRAVSKILRIQ
jgi:hypothetical protein